MCAPPEALSQELLAGCMDEQIPATRVGCGDGGRSSACCSRCLQCWRTAIFFRSCAVHARGWTAILTGLTLPLWGLGVAWFCCACDRSCCLLEHPLWILLSSPPLQQFLQPLLHTLFSEGVRSV